MKILRISLFMSGTVLATLGQVDRTLADSGTAVSPMGACIRPVSYQSSTDLPALAPQLLTGLLHAPPQDNRRLQIGLARPFIQPIVVDRNTVPLSQWTLMPDGWSVWMAEVGSEGALGMRIHLEALSLPKDARIIVYDPANPQPDSNPITQRSLTGRRDVWTATLFTTHAVVECQVPPGTDPSQVSFIISGVSHLYALPLSGTAPLEGSCHNDVTCYPDYSAQASGVARMAFVQGGNTFVCTGCLLAGNDSSQALFLTANHCIYDQTIASTIELFWFFQTSTCNGTPPSLNSVPRTTGGADLLATSSGNDFSFMRLRQMPPSGAQPLDWSASPPSSSDTLACIHHPTGAYKRISFGHEIGATANFWGVQWDSGATEPGSSGSPLLNASHQVIGQLNAGFNGSAGSSCTDTNAPDQFGRFDLTFPQIQQWLNGTAPPPSTEFPRGIYNGLFFDSNNGPDLQSAGSFTVTLSTKNRFSARLQMAAARYSFSGQFDGNGSAQFFVPHHNLGGQLQLDPNDTDHITGTLTDGNFNSQLDGDRMVFNALSNPTDLAGQYTIVIPNGTDPSSSPGGDSYALVSVDRIGRLHLSGALSDNIRFSQSTSISKNGRWPLFAPLYGGRGFLFSWVTFGDNAGDDMEGQVTWVRPTLPLAKLYPQGFTYQNSLFGSRYTRPPPGGSVLDLPNATIVFNGGDLGDIYDPISIGAFNRVTNLSPDRLSVTFSTGSGTFHGYVIPAGQRRAVSFSGVVFQKQNTANGYFLGSTDAGYVFIGSN